MLTRHFVVGATIGDLGRGAGPVELHRAYIQAKVQLARYTARECFFDRQRSKILTRTGFTVQFYNSDKREGHIELHQDQCSAVLPEDLHRPNFSTHQHFADRSHRNLGRRFPLQ